MIRINLVQAPAETLNPKKVEPVNPNRQNALSALVSVVVCFGIAGLFYQVWTHEIARLNDQAGVARREAARLAGIQAQNRRYETDLAQIENHVRVIQALETSRTGPQDLMTRLGNMVDGISGLYLLSVKSDGSKLVIDGQADRVNAIADFIAGLQSNSSFQKIELHQVFEDDRNDRVSFKFDLECLYTPPVETAASVLPAAPTGNPGRPPGR